MGPPRDRDIWPEATGHCSGCPLGEAPIVAGDGPPEPVLVVVGEAPGEKEVDLRKPFVGDAGENLRAALSLVDIDDESVHFTNATLCYPGRNVRTGEYNHPSPPAIDACRPRLLREIRATLATKVLAAGRYAGRSLTHQMLRIGTWRCVIAGPLERHLLGDGVDVGLTYHPKARVSDPIAEVASDLRCLLARP